MFKNLSKGYCPITIKQAIQIQKIFQIESNDIICYDHISCDIKDDVVFITFFTSRKYPFGIIKYKKRSRWCVYRNGGCYCFFY